MKPAKRLGEPTPGIFQELFLRKEALEAEGKQSTIFQSEHRFFHRMT